MKNQKILFTIAFPLYGTGSGTDTRTVMDSAKKSGYQVAALCADNKTTYPKDEDIHYYTVPFKATTPDAETIPGQCDFPYIMYTSHPDGKTLNYFTSETSLDIIVEYSEQFQKYLSKAINEFKPDLINAQHNWLLSAQVARYNLPMVLKIHGTDLMGYTKSQELVKNLEDEISKYTSEKIKSVSEEILSKSSNIKEICFKLNELKQNVIGQTENEKLIDLYKELAKYKFYISESEYSAKKADQIVVISEAQKEQFKKLFPNESNKVTLLENGYNTDVFYMDKTTKPEDVIPKLHSNITPDGKIPMDYDDLILFVGKFADFKGIDSMLIANKIYDEKLKGEGKKPLTIIVGSGQLEEKLQQEAKYLGLENTHFVGRQGHDIIRPLQNLATVSLIPSRDEPFGLVVIEGTSCGHPVIASNSGGIPDILNTEKENLPDEDIITTKLGVLIKPLPKGPKGLTKEQTENLNSIAYTYIAANPDQKKAVLADLTKRLGIYQEDLLKYFNEYTSSTEALATSVQKIVNKEFEFDGNEIAEYTKSKFAQDVINKKTVKIYDAAIENKKKIR